MAYVLLYSALSMILRNTCARCSFNVILLHIRFYCLLKLRQGMSFKQVIALRVYGVLRV